MAGIAEYGDGYGSEYGDGDGTGSGYGDGYGSGYGAGYGAGYGYGARSGTGYGAGSGYGAGYGYGSGSGAGAGDGSGYGDGSGDGDGAGYGSGAYWRLVWQMRGFLPPYDGGILAWKCLTASLSGMEGAPHQLDQTTIYHHPGNACVGPAGAARDWSQNHQRLTAVVVPSDSPVLYNGVLSCQQAKPVGIYVIENANTFRFVAGLDIARLLSIF